MEDAQMNSSDEPCDDEITLVFVRTATGLQFERKAREASPSRREVSARAPSSHSDGLWDANDVAGFLKLSRSWVYHRAEAGLLPSIRVGGLLRFDPIAIRASA